MGNTAQHIERENGGPQQEYRPARGELDAENLQSFEAAQRAMDTALKGGDFQVPNEQDPEVMMAVETLLAKLNPSLNNDLQRAGNLANSMAWLERGKQMRLTGERPTQDDGQHIEQAAAFVLADAKKELDRLAEQGAAISGGTSHEKRLQLIFDRMKAELQEKIAAEEAAQAARVEKMAEDMQTAEATPEEAADNDIDLAQENPDVTFPTSGERLMDAQYWQEWHAKVQEMYPDDPHIAGDIQRIIQTIESGKQGASLQVGKLVERINRAVDEANETRGMVRVQEQRESSEVAKAGAEDGPFEVSDFQQMMDAFNSGADPRIIANGLNHALGQLRQQQRGGGTETALGKDDHVKPEDVQDVAEFVKSGHTLDEGLAMLQRKVRGNGAESEQRRAVRRAQRAERRRTATEEPGEEAPRLMRFSDEDVRAMGGGRGEPRTVRPSDGLMGADVRAAVESTGAGKTDILSQRIKERRAEALQRAGGAALGDAEAQRATVDPDRARMFEGLDQSGAAAEALRELQNGAAFEVADRHVRDRTYWSGLAKELERDQQFSDSELLKQIRAFEAALGGKGQAPLPPEEMARFFEDRINSRSAAAKKINTFIRDRVLSIPADRARDPNFKYDLITLLEKNKQFDPHPEVLTALQQYDPRAENAEEQLLQVQEAVNQYMTEDRHVKEGRVQRREELGVDDVLAALATDHDKILRALDAGLPHEQLRYELLQLKLDVDAVAAHLDELTQTEAERLADDLRQTHGTLVQRIKEPNPSVQRYLAKMQETVQAVKQSAEGQEGTQAEEEIAPEEIAPEELSAQAQEAGKNLIRQFLEIKAGRGGPDFDGLVDALDQLEGKEAGLRPGSEVNAMINGLNNIYEPLSQAAGYEDLAKKIAEASWRIYKAVYPDAA